MHNLLTIGARAISGLMNFLTAHTDPATDIFEQAELVVNGFIQLLIALFGGIGALLWVSGTGLTFLGILVVMAFGIAIVWFGFRLIMGLFRPRG